MPAVSYKLKGLGTWMKAAANPELFRVILQNKMHAATRKNAALGARAMRSVIQNGIAPPNAALTILIKKSSKPLVGLENELFSSISGHVLDPYTAFAGVPKLSKRFELASILHNGITIQVTPAMRGMFFFLWKAASGEMDPGKLEGRAAELFRIQPRGWKPLLPSTTAIVIPARPWVQKAFDDAEFKRTVVENWQMALRSTYAEIARYKGND